MDEVSVAALPATIPEPGSFEISSQLSYFPRHDASLQANSSEVDAQRLKLSDPAHGTRGLQPERDGRVRCSAWLGRTPEDLLINMALINVVKKLLG